MYGGVMNLRLIRPANIGNEINSKGWCFSTTTMWKRLIFHQLGADHILIWKIDHLNPIQVLAFVSKSHQVLLQYEKFSRSFAGASSGKDNFRTRCPSLRL